MNQNMQNMLGTQDWGNAKGYGEKTKDIQKRSPLGVCLCVTGSYGVMACVCVYVCVCDWGV